VSKRGRTLWSTLFLSFEIGQPVKRTLQDYHDRMPVLLQPEKIDGWLSGAIGKERLVPAREEVLQTWPVSRRVNSSRADESDHTLIAEVAL
jgi:putative SOS response-associated peptidase YedK